ncbi:hypothetical protein PILCRDRAFT_650121 [Piloderma croceum F 1598]|uniref:Transmembrane protein n=1 Tax=Piloderma croceum (strain F 1598) TaxID=765440 RepID=A0A0C3AQR0_PILCF|nr:hypothetical protein PILCRDRAFT_650121 [Piloderma croceum F 1598]
MRSGGCVPRSILKERRRLSERHRYNFYLEYCLTLRVKRLTAPSRYPRTFLRRRRSRVDFPVRNLPRFLCVVLFLRSLHASTNSTLRSGKLEKGFLGPFRVGGYSLASILPPFLFCLVLLANHRLLLLLVLFQIFLIRPHNQISLTLQSSSQSLLSSRVSYCHHRSR